MLCIVSAHTVWFAKMISAFLISPRLWREICSSVPLSPLIPSTNHPPKYFIKQTRRPPGVTPINTFISSSDLCSTLDDCKHPRNLLSVHSSSNRPPLTMIVGFFFNPSCVSTFCQHLPTDSDISASLLASIQVSSAGMFWYFLLTALIKSRRLCLVSLIGYQSCSCTSKRLQRLILYPPWGILAVVKHLIHLLKSDLHWKI